MKKKVLLMIPLAFLMLFAAAAPVMAYDPKPDFSFTIGGVYVPTAPPPTVILTESGEIVLGAHAIDYSYSSILSYQVLNEEDWFYQNLKTFTGYGVDTIISSSSEEHDVFTINGLGPWTYTGPTFTYSGRTCDAAVSGAKITTGGFYGILGTGTGSIHFTSGPLAGKTAVDTFAIVLFSDSSGIYCETVYVP